MDPNFWKGRRVLVTGHTGFKGGWLALWLTNLGARVHGLALDPPTKPSLFVAAGIARVLASHTVGDIRDRSTVNAVIGDARPEVVFHLAAQSLVRASYLDPLATFGTNVMGTVNVLEALRSCSAVRSIVIVTTDKCYESDDSGRPHPETDPLGGHDPYASSKACAELVALAYRRSFFAELGSGVSTARAGNVIGGGDWAEDRLIPDFLRSWDSDTELVVRSPDATRPWQHVLEPVSGYLRLAQRLHEWPRSYAGAWNFGPPPSDAKPVRWLVERLCEAAPGSRWRIDGSSHPHEAKALSLDSSKASKALGWQSRWELRRSLQQTLGWHQAWRSGQDVFEACMRQIAEYGDEA